jgi:cell wall-associated protease
MKKLILNSFIILNTLGLSLSLQAGSEITDTLYPKQWGLINYGQTIFRSTGELTRDEVQGKKGIDINWTDLEKYDLPKEREIVVAVLDSGIDIDHPDLQGRIWRNKKYCPENGNEYPEKACYGYNFLKKSSLVLDDTGHGTHVAGIIAANTNGKGVVGLADKRIKIMPVKILSQDVKSFIYDNRVYTDIVADAVKFAVINNADVINLSLGWPKLIETKKIRVAIENAAKRNIPIIVAAGNNNKNIPTYPCSTNNVICVGSIGPDGKISEFSNYGGKIDILAPGEGIVSTYPTKGVESRILRIQGYELKKGTSQAAPFITGIVASLKMLNPEMSLGEVKARLFQSAHPVAMTKFAHKSSKFGLVNMKKALELTPKNFVTPIFKDILDIKYSYPEGTFSFNLPIESFLEKENVSIDLSIEEKGIKLEQGHFELKDLAYGKGQSIEVKGKILNFNQDNNFNFQVKIKTESGFESNVETALMMARVIKKENVIRYPISGTEAKELLIIKKKRKLVRIKRIGDRYHLKENPEFFRLISKKQTETETVVTFLRKNGNEFKSKELNLPKLSKIIAIFVNDSNRDGQLDYFIYGINSEKTQLIFDFVDEDLSPLFGDKSRWHFPISTFEGLPIKSGFESAFHWVAIDNSPVGPVLVPALYKGHKMPDADNTDDYLFRIPEDLVSPHLYYLRPALKDGKMNVELRVIDSYSFQENLMNQWSLDDRSEVFLEKPFYQTKNERLNGQLRTLVSSGEEFLKSYFYLSIDSLEKQKTEILPYSNTFLSGNTPYPIFNLDGEQKTVSEQALMVALLDRQNFRAHFLSQKSFKGKSLEMGSKAWSDPIFNFITAHEQNDEISLFFESRYFVHAFDKEGKGSILPINRDSTFPGVDFSESLEPLALTFDGKKTSGVFINSVLIFGDRLYSMVKNDEGLIRPIAASISIPENCGDMDPMAWGEERQDSYMFLCENEEKKIEIWQFPLVF